MFNTAGYHEVIDMDDDSYLDVIDGFIEDPQIFGFGAELKRLESGIQVIVPKFSRLDASI